MQHYGDNFVPVVPEEHPLHTPKHPFCYDDTCGCHDDETLVTDVLDAYTAGLLTSQEATLMMQGKLL
jgi:hypothetical protein